MKKKQIIALSVAVLLFILTGVSSVLTNRFAKNLFEEEVTQLLAGDQEIDLPDREYIAVVDVIGTIQEQTETSVYSDTQSYRHDTTKEYIDALIADPENRGILLYVDSPGGTVYEADELYQKLVEYKEMTGNPIWVYMAHYAASGGYYVSAPADVIYANKNTTTGSIGVIMSGYDLTGLYEKLGIRYVSIASGVNKDSSALTDEQVAIYQSQVDEAFEDFVSIVAEGRGLPADEVRQLADGRTYTARQAQQLGLVDEISDYETMKAEMCASLEVYEFYSLPQAQSGLLSLFSEIKDTLPRSEAQVLKEMAEEMESGVLMYYAG